MLDFGHLVHDLKGQGHGFEAVTGQSYPKDSLTYDLIGAAMRVHSELGPGYLEAVYHDALGIELEEAGIPFAHEVPVPIMYRGRRLGHPYRADFICYGQVILEIKAQRDLSDADRNQVVHYLKATRKSLGLLLNFGEPELEFRRYIFTHPPDT